MEKVFTSKFVRTGPSSYEKRIYWAAVSQRLRNTGLEGQTCHYQHSAAPSIAEVQRNVWLTPCIRMHTCIYIYIYIHIYIYTHTEWTKKCIHSLLINIFGIYLNEISISG